MGWAERIALACGPEIAPGAVVLPFAAGLVVWELAGRARKAVRHLRARARERRLAGQVTAWLASRERHSPGSRWQA